MVQPIEIESLRALCGTIASSDFDTLNRIKSIAQVAHEHLGTSSIVVYGYNRVTEQLDILAMPGVTKRELMRGPTDKIIFGWEDWDSGRGRHGVWLEDDPAFDEYIRELTDCAKRRETSLKLYCGDFRVREAQKHAPEGGERKRVAMAKLYLWKGLDQTGDRVGQVFFNFCVSPNDPPVFSPELKSVIRFIANVIRELLIERLYHTDLPTPRLSPEGLLRELNLAFDSAMAESDSRQSRIEECVAGIFSKAALSITENYNGYADFVLLIGERLGRVFTGQSNFEPPRPGAVRSVLIARDSISGTCIREKKYFVGSEVKLFSAGSDGATVADPVKAATRWPPEYGLPECTSLMVVPVVHDDEVRALIRLTSPRKGCFLDAQARAMQNVEQLARYGILRLDEWRQREQMSRALDFYTTEMRTPSTGDPAYFMQGVLRALGANWGTFWPLDRIDPEHGAEISHGILIQPGADPTFILPGDIRYGVRGQRDDRAGFTQMLVRANSDGVGHDSNNNIFFCVHILPKGSQCAHGVDSKYYLQLFSQNRPQGDPADLREFNDGFFRYGITEHDQFYGHKPPELNPNTPEDRHTRFAFVVRADQRIRAVVWLKFPELREVTPWERQYLAGLSNSLGKLMQVNDLYLAVRNFRHMVPSMTLLSENELDALAKHASDAEGTARLENLRTYMLTMMLKCAEVNSLLAPVEYDNAEDLRHAFIPRPLAELVNRAIDCAISFRTNRSPWDWSCEGVEKGDLVNGLFYSVLLNLLKNVVIWGWCDFPEEKQRAYIWVRCRDGNITTCVGNCGNPLTRNPLEGAPDWPRKDHGTGLRAMKTLLQQRGGDLRYVARDVVLSGELSPEPPPELRKCDTFFEFWFPNTL